MSPEPTIASIAPLPRTDVEPSWVARGAWMVDADIMRSHFGHDELTDSLSRMLANYAHQVAERTVHLVAVRGGDVDALPVGEFGLPELSYDAARAPGDGEVVGHAELSWTTEDNPSVGYAWIGVSAPERGRGLGSRLLAAAEQILADQGRSVVQSWVTHAAPAPGGEQIVPASGVSSIAPDVQARFAQRHGYVLEQCERHSVLTVPVPAATLAGLWDDALPAAADYEIATYAGPLPAGLVASMCRMFTHFSESEPHAGLESEAESWTPERYAAREARRAAAGIRSVTALATHRATGEVVALTELSLPPDHPHVAYQNVTVVDAAHRGHRLGWLTKVANLRELQRTHPACTTIHTWNAHENGYMLAINNALGFVEHTAEGAWQKRRPSA